MPDFDISYSGLPESMFEPFQPKAVPKPEFVLVNNKLASRIGIDKKWLKSKTALDLFSANTSPKHQPIAMAYAGHQFGGFSPRLGDGRAVLLAEFIGRDNMRYDIHLKGSGKTRFSRGGDGKATLRAALKEYIFSESLAALGIPSTRSLAVLLTGEIVPRQQYHPGAILVRTAKSHIRVGTFQYARMKGRDTVKALADYTLTRLYPQIKGDKYIGLLEIVIKKQARLIAKWMSFGFIHGVMNTDNMSISGESIDFGPCAFMESFRADQVFSSIDQNGRYAWNNQPKIALWNLTRLAESLLPLLHSDEEKALEIASQKLGGFSSIYADEFNHLMLAKLGLGASEGAKEILAQALALLTNYHPDYTLFFYYLSKVLDGVLQGAGEDDFLSLFADQAQAKNWLQNWQKMITDKQKSLNLMQALNPLYIPRFHQTEQALKEAEQGNMKPFNQLLRAIQNPFTEGVENPEFEKLAKPITNTPSPSITYCET